MDIVNFFEKIEGTWFSQRTTHFELGHPSQTGQATLTITRPSANDPRIVGLCQQFDANSAGAIFTLKVCRTGQASTYGSALTTPEAETILVGLKQNAPSVGRFFSQTESAIATEGQYLFENEVLTFKAQHDDYQCEERLWFMNPNLRMRTSLLTRSDGFRMASFCSEIRRMTSSSP